MSFTVFSCANCAYSRTRYRDLSYPCASRLEKIGRYEVVCTQLCGLGHSNMHTYLDVVSQEDFAAFLKNGGQ